MRPAEPGLPRLTQFGDDAVLVELAATAGIREARRARALARTVHELRESDPRLGEPVPGAASVLVPFDASRLEIDALLAMLEPIATAVPDDPPPDPGAREILLTVRYGRDDGPDLAAVARETGMTPDQVIELHTAAALEVLFIGFAPGFAYLGQLVDELVVPRLATPRTRVPAGSVAIAGRMTGVYPQVSPGGWRILGRTDARLFDPSADVPVRLRPGDHVRFRAR